MSANGVDDDFDPAQPERNTHLRMWTHIVQKGWQVGSVIGTSAVLPIAYYRARALEPALSAAGMAIPAGVVFACAMGTYMLAGEPREAVEDRVYRLYYNEGQNRVDTFAQMGAAAGALAAVAQLQGQGSYRSRAWSALGQVGVGTVVGIGAHAIFPAKKDE